MWKPSKMSTAIIMQHQWIYSDWSLVMKDSKFKSGESICPLSIYRNCAQSANSQQPALDGQFIGEYERYLNVIPF